MYYYLNNKAYWDTQTFNNKKRIKNGCNKGAEILLSDEKKKDVGVLLPQVELKDFKAIQERTMNSRVLSYMFVSSPLRMTT